MATRRFKVLLSWDAETHTYAAIAPAVHEHTQARTRVEALARIKDYIGQALEAGDQERPGLHFPAEREEAGDEVVWIEVPVPSVRR